MPGPTKLGGIVISASATPGVYVASFDWDMDGNAAVPASGFIASPTARSASAA